MVEIIRADISHLEEVAPLFDAYRQFYGQEPNLALAREFSRERFIALESVIFLARQVAHVGSGSAIGFVQLYPIFSSIGCRRALILNDLYVASEFRRHGVARQLMQAATEYAKLVGAEYLELATQVGNTKAQALYESLGYKRDSEFYHYVLVL